MIVIDLEPDIERRLDWLAEKTGQSSTYFVREAILGYLEDVEDGIIALERLNNPGKFSSSEEVRRELGL